MPQKEKSLPGGNRVGAQDQTITKDLCSSIVAENIKNYKEEIKNGS